MFCTDIPAAIGVRFVQFCRTPLGYWQGKAPSCLAERFSLLLAGICHRLGAQMAASRRYPEDPAQAAVWHYLFRVAQRFVALAARADAGTLPAPRRRAPPEAASAPDPNSRKPRPPRPLPRGWGWLLRAVPGCGFANAYLQQHLLPDPDLAALLALAPQAGRLLRPLCHALAVPIPETLRRPPRLPDPARQAARDARAAERAAERSARAQARAEARAAARAEAAWARAFRRSLGLPARPPADARPAHAPPADARSAEASAGPPAARARPPPKPA